MAREGVRDHERRGCEVARPDQRMDPALEVAVAREHGDHGEVVLGHGVRHLLRQRPRVPDARRAPEPHEREAELVEVRREPGRVEVLGHDARTRSERRLDPRLGVQARLDGLLREQAGREHHGGVRRVRAARDRGDHDRAVTDRAVVERHRLLRTRLDGLVGVDPDLRVPALLEEPADLARVGVGLEPVAERLDERTPHARERDAVLRPLRSGDRGFDRGEVELDDLGEGRLGVAVATEQALLLRVALDEIDPVAPPGEPEVAQGLVVDRPVRGRGPVLGAHVRQRRAVRELERRAAVAEELHEPSDHPVLAEHLGERQDQVGRRRPGRERAANPNADDERRRQEHRLAEHRGLGLDPAHAPPEHAEPVHHRRVGVGPHQRVGERDAVLDRDHLAEVLEVHLVADPRAGRHHADAVERLLRPAQQRVPLAVAPVLPLDVRLVRRRRAEQVDLHRVIDDQVHVHQRRHPGRVAAGARHRRAHRGQIDDRGHAREVLHQDP